MSTRDMARSYPSTQVLPLLFQLWQITFRIGLGLGFRTALPPQDVHFFQGLLQGNLRGSGLRAMHHSVRSGW